MRYIFSVLLVLAAITFSCNDTPEKPLSFTEKVAMANGLDNWNTIDELRFTFNVDRDTMHFERSWIWNPKTGQVSMTVNGETITYNRDAVDERSLQADKAFINDSYWLLAPFKLVWDEGYSMDSIIKAEAPISKDSLYKLTILYEDTVGYTPGDAYDFYIGEDYMVKEWVYREDNSESNCMMTTWEEYEEEGGLKLSTLHRDDTGHFSLYFTDIAVSTDN
ncbi:hypothetical protein [Robertkochia flava]|uniref:hypothetical protein n=1 Tax=Robertkochia flava TaxID=3447986 RepID=UPI001CCE7E8A|nr:hypothetical protein [Robertkochia marina]